MIFLPTQSSRSHLTRRHPARRAFCTIVVILSMSFIALAVAAMTGLFNHEARRTRATLAQTQLRQLLLAAAPAAQAESKTPGTRDVPFPTPIPDASVTLHVQNNTVHVTATFRGYPASQTLIFSNGALTETTLDATSNQ